jgi:hypothetical protein
LTVASDSATIGHEWTQVDQEKEREEVATDGKRKQRSKLMSTRSHKIDEQYIMGKIAEFDGGRGRVVAIEVSEFGDILFSIEPLDGGNLVVKKMQECSLGRRENVIPAFPDQIREAFEAASKHRSSVVDNITYARQISGESTKEYERQLSKCDELCSALAEEMKKLKVV